MNHKIKFKSDAFKKNRGGYSRWLKLFCEKCTAELAVYQKDGPGILKRLYADRIVSEESLKKAKNLQCNACGAILGVRTIYEKENRIAYRLFAGAVGKKIVKGERVLPKAAQ